MKTIQLQELAARVGGATQPVLVEALPARYYDDWHLPRAININIGEVKAKAPALLPDKSADIVVYCASDTCSNSDQVAVQLHALGYSNVAVFKGGKAAWQAAGLAIEKSPAALAV
jgi:rhodanese-related sulfurtransferase